MQPVFPPQGRRIDTGALQAGLDACVGLVESKENARLALPGTGRDEADGVLEFPLRLPEVRQMVAGCNDRPSEAKRHAGAARPRAVKAVLAEQAEEPLFLRAGRRLPRITDASEGPDDGLHLRDGGAASRAGAAVGFEALPVGWREISFQVERDLICHLAAGHCSGGHRLLTPLRDRAEAPPVPSNAPGAAALSDLSRESPGCYTPPRLSALRRRAS